MPPATPLVGVVDRAHALEAPRAERNAGRRRDVEQHPIGLQVDGQDASLFQREDPREYRGDAHGGAGLLCLLGSCKVAPPPVRAFFTPSEPSPTHDPSAIRPRHAAATATALPSNLRESLEIPHDLRGERKAAPSTPEQKMAEPGKFAQESAKAGILLMTGGLQRPS